MMHGPTNLRYTKHVVDVGNRGQNFWPQHGTNTVSQKRKTAQFHDRANS